MITIDKVFKGHTPVDQRKFIRLFLSREKAKYPKVNIPCVGAFTLVKSAIEAGYKPEQITCSDISLYSSLLGYYFMDKPISELNFSVVPEIADEYNALTEDVDRIAFLFYQMKRCQYKAIYAEQMMREELEHEKDAVIATFKKELLEIKPTYRGITYYQGDLRAELTPRPDTITIINPPVITRGYTKMFNFAEFIKYDYPVQEFVWSKEYIPLFEKTIQIDSPFVWYRFKNSDGIDSKHIIFAKEYPKRWDYWLINKPEFYPYPKILKSMKHKPPAPLKDVQMYNEEEIRPDSKIRIFKIKEENALYYRGLFVHKLGTVKAEVYVAVTVDGKLMGTAGFMLNKALRLTVDYVFESYAFSTPSARYPALGRLLMMFLTCRDTRRFLQNCFPKNQFYQFNSFKTTCLSKYNRVKKNNGLMEIEECIREGNFFKIHYATKFWDRSYADCIAIWLKEIADGKKY